jgi:hypothetical protein
MKVLGHRFAHVAEPDDAQAFNTMLQSLGLTPLDLNAILGSEAAAFEGAVYETGPDGSMVQIWAAGEQMPAGTMLQIVVDDAEAFADHARSNGLDPQGPFDMHGERVFMLTAPGGMPVSFQSKLKD